MTRVDPRTLPAPKLPRRGRNPAGVAIDVARPRLVKPEPRHGFERPTRYETRVRFRVPLYLTPRGRLGAWLDRILGRAPLGAHFRTDDDGDLVYVDGAS